MSDLDFSVDDILSEFYKDIEGKSGTSGNETETVRPAEERRAPVYEEPAAPAAPAAPAYEEPARRNPYLDDFDASCRQEEKTPGARPAAPVSSINETLRKSRDFEDFLNAVEENDRAKEQLRREKYEPMRQQRRDAGEEDPYGYGTRTARQPEDGFYDLPRKKESAEEEYDGQSGSEFVDDYDEPRPRKPIYTSKRNSGRSLRFGLIKGVGGICAVLSLLVLAWVGINVHPESETMTFSKTNAKTNLISRLDTYSNNSKVDVLSSVEEIAEQAVIKKVYKIPEDQLVAPSPVKANFGTLPIGEASKVMDIIAQAKVSGLLEDQEVLFSPDANFYWDSDIEYYLDDTIMVICWKEQVEGRVTSMVEVKIADGSQLRRKICEDTYGSSVYLYCSELAQQANAVIAMNSDYYAFRDLGITCYDRTVYRFNDYNYYGSYKAYNVTDTLFINPEGDFVFFKRGTETTKEEVQRWVDENNLLYSVAFGPILVDDYNLVEITDYPVGEINTEYSRAGIAQVDKLHYLYMAVSHSNEGTPRCTVSQFGQMFANKGVRYAYCLDGGQTGEVFFQGKPYNHIDFGNERTVSDIIYFATAIGEEAMS